MVPYRRLKKIIKKEASFSTQPREEERPLPRSASPSPSPSPPLPPTSPIMSPAPGPPDPPNVANVGSNGEPEGDEFFVGKKIE